MDRVELNVESYVNEVTEQARLYNEIKDLREMLQEKNIKIKTMQNEKNDFCRDLIEYLKTNTDNVDFSISHGIKRILAKYEL